MNTEATQSMPSRYMFILPNLFTLGSLFAGFYAITVLTSESGNPQRFLLASLALLIATICDGLDGRVARMTHTQSDFGLQMDSLVDLVSFGIAPALLVYKWSLHELGLVGMMIAFAFAGAGACRLARFNVLEIKAKTEKKQKGPSRHFVGLPIPLAAGMLISMIVFIETTDFFAPMVAVVGLTLLLSFLMVSNFRFRTFKDLKMNSTTTSILGILVSALAVCVWQLSYAHALLILFSAYIISGMVAEVAGFLTRRLHATRTA